MYKTSSLCQVLSILPLPPHPHRHHLHHLKLPDLGLSGVAGFKISMFLGIKFNRIDKPYLHFSWPLDRQRQSVDRLVPTGLLGGPLLSQ